MKFESLSMDKPAKTVFKQGSRTYYHSSRFFPRELRKDIADLYSFVRVADDFVDTIPQNVTGFKQFKHGYQDAWRTQGKAGNPIIDNFIDLQHKYQFDPQWIESFFISMEMDLHKSLYRTLEETLGYIHGSAEVIGWFMARIMNLPQAAMEPAARLGRAMQYINFIRDINQDNALGRQYLPTQATPLADLRQSTAASQPAIFKQFIRDEIERYQGWQAEAVAGYQYLPRGFLIPIKTAADMYQWTARTIAENPFIVFQKKVKPTKSRIIVAGLINGLFPKRKN